MGSNRASSGSASAPKQPADGGSSDVAAVPVARRRLRQVRLPAGARDAALAHLRASNPGEALLLLRGMSRGKLKVGRPSALACSAAAQVPPRTMGQRCAQKQPGRALPR